MILLLCTVVIVEKNVDKQDQNEITEKKEEIEKMTDDNNSRKNIC